MSALWYSCADFNDELDSIVRDADEKTARERMRWPNPNPEDILEQLWSDYQDAYARHFFGRKPLMSPTGIPEDTADQLAITWQAYQDAVVLYGL